MTEFELIERLCAELPTNPSTVVGAGDDCAVLDLGLPGRWLLFKTDAVVAGVHFQPDTDPARVGRKALARCLSDIAAMAGCPTHALVTLALPDQFDVAWADGVYAGLSRLAEQHGVAIVGGETTSSRERALVSVTVLGSVERARCPLRSAARPGDAIFVTGELGGSLASGKHLDFEPRLEEARWLASQVSLHAMIDVSDGLAGDLRHILKASGVGAEILADAIPLSQAARAVAGVRASNSSVGGAHPPALVAALTEGEDFELLFTIPAGEAVRLLDAWKQRFPDLRLGCIGKITAARGLTLRERDRAQPLTLDGYVHFQKP
jgi:thiamine-monophosphate kinase